MANLLLNKPATASNSFAPFLPVRAVDGSTTDPKSRWVCAQLPGWLCIDMQNNYLINQWNANFMGSAGWAANYNICDFKLQGSLDNANWFDMDVIANNTASTINRTITAKLARYLRVYITKGLSLNNQVASIVDFQASEPANAPFLSGLTTNEGTLSPGFSSRTFNYTLNVASTVNTITFTPIAPQSSTVLKLSTANASGTVIASAQPTAATTLNYGSNLITIQAATADGSLSTTYTVNVIKASVSNLQLTNVAVGYSGRGITSGTILVSMVGATTTYNQTVPKGTSAITLKPTATDSTVVVKVNGTQVPTGGTSSSIGVNSTVVTNVSVLVSSSDGLSTRTYTFNISVASN